MNLYGNFFTIYELFEFSEQEIKEQISDSFQIQKDFIDIKNEYDLIEHKRLLQDLLREDSQSFIYMNISLN